MLMEHHSVYEALERLRDHSRAANWKGVVIASAVVGGHPLLAQWSVLAPCRVAIVELARRSLGPLSFRAIHDQGSGGKREAE
jgi:hypothetical protein